MGRPKGSLNRGFLFSLNRKGRELLMASKQKQLSVDDLSAAASDYRRLLKKAMRVASPSDPVMLQRLGAGLNALTKALATIEQATRGEKAPGVFAPID